MPVEFERKNMPGSSFLHIPLSDLSQPHREIRVPKAEAVAEASRIMAVLEQENSPLSLWKNVASFYYRIECYTEFETFLDRAIKRAATWFIDATTFKSDTDTEIEFSVEHIENCLCLATHYADKALSVKLDSSASRPDPASLLAAADKMVKRAETVLEVDQRGSFSSYSKDDIVSLHGEMLRRTAALNDAVADRSLLYSPPLCLAYIHLVRYATLYEDPPSSLLQLKKAMDIYRGVLNVQPDNSLAKLGVATIHFNLHQFHEALDIFRSLAANQSALARETQLRSAIGACLYGLHQPEEALTVYRKVLLRDPSNQRVLAMILGIALVSHLDPGQRIQKQVPSLVEALKGWEPVQNRSAASALMLATLAFYSGLNDLTANVLHHGSQRLSLGCGKHLCAEYWYQEARIKHAARDYSSAMSLYQKSLRHDPYWVSSQYGFIQCLLYFEELGRAQQQLQILTRLVPSNYHTALLLIYYCTKKAEAALTKPPQYGGKELAFENTLHQRTSDAHTYCITALQLCHKLLSDSKLHDPKLLLLYIQLNSFCQDHLDYHLCGVSLSRNLVWAYTTLVAGCPDLSPRTRLECRVNLSAELGKLCDFTRALEILSEVETDLEALGPGTDHEETEALTALTLLNKALALEHLGDTKSASNLYKRLCSLLPKSYRPWERRCLLSLKRKDLRSLMSYFLSALKQGVDPAALPLVQCAVYTQQEKHQHLVEKLKAQLQTHKRSDPRLEALLQCLLAGSHMRLFQQKSRDNALASSVKAEMLNHVGTWYKRALSLDPSNWYACNGLVTLLAEHNKIDLAIKGYTKLLDACRRLQVDRFVASPLTSTHLEQKSSSRFVHMEFITLINLGYCLLIKAMDQRPSILPGKDVSRNHKIALTQSLNYYLTALKLKPYDQRVYFHLSHFYYDTSDFDRGVALLEMACTLWPDSTAFRHNLARMMEKRLKTQIKSAQRSYNAAMLRDWIRQCEIIEALYVVNLSLLWPYESLGAQEAAKMRSYFVQGRKASPNCLNVASFIQTKLNNIVPFPPLDLESLPPSESLKEAKREIGARLKAYLNQMLVKVEQKESLELNRLHELRDSIATSAHDLSDLMGPPNTNSIRDIEALLAEDAAHILDLVEEAHSVKKVTRKKENTHRP